MKNINYKNQRRGVNTAFAEDLNSVPGMHTGKFPTSCSSSSGRHGPVFWTLNIPEFICEKFHTQTHTCTHNLK